MTKARKAQHRFALFEDFSQCVELGVVNPVHGPVLVIDRALSHLSELSGQDPRARGDDGLAHEVSAQLFVPAHIKAHRDQVIDPLR